MGQKRDLKKRAKEAAKRTEQHKKNREAKIKPTVTAPFKPKPGQLPDKHVMDAIAESLHEAVTSVFDDLERSGANTKATRPDATLKGRCLYYSAAGQYVAEEFVGRVYWVQIGSLVFKTDSEHTATIDATKGGVEGRNFHMWLGTDDGGIEERIDFTSQYFKEWAEKSGATWDREELPSYIWGEKTEIMERLGVRFEPVISTEAEADRQIQANEPIIDLIVERAKAIARKRLLK